jgi:drug/metabolite transporter (DMT)-like permease
MNKQQYQQQPQEKEETKVKMPLSEQTKQYLSHGLLLTSQICFSGWHIVGSLVLKDGASPFVFALYREMFAAIVMYGIVRYTGQKVFMHPEDRIRFLFLGFFSFVNVIGAILSLQYLSATRFAIFQPCIPCVATVISVLLGLEAFSVIKTIGVSIAVGGAILAEAWKEEGKNDDDGDGNIVLGSIIASIQITGMACLVVFAKPILSKYNSAVTTFFYYGIGTVYTIILFAVVSFTFTANDLYFDGNMLPWMGLVYVSLVATVYPYNALSWGGRHLSPSTTTVYSTFQPVGTMILSLIILNKVVTTPELVGGALVIVGLVVTVYGQNYENWLTMKERLLEENDKEKDLLADHYRGMGEHNSASGGAINDHLRNSDLINDSTPGSSASQSFFDQEYHYGSRQISFTPGYNNNNTNNNNNSSSSQNTTRNGYLYGQLKSEDSL